MMKNSIMAATNGKEDDPWEDPVFRNAYGMLDVLEYLQKTGALTPHDSVSFGRDLRAIVEEIRERAFEKGVTLSGAISRESILISKIHELNMIRPQPSPR
ncbi:hypothetical protein KW800_01075 [Candidatus Parcubacteria bacterium]|nr:hypothetical protein [Candidatus Parcubacteria bacterium]